jgi:hypothetical protein
MKSFIPFHQLKDREAIVVDGAHSSGLILSHWKGQNIIQGIADDTSGAIVLNALKKKIAGLEIPLVTATHFDIDGFVGVWSLFEPELALKHEKVLKAVARIGDFRELDLSAPEDDEALKLVCWIDAEERRRFYRPFGSEHELSMCSDKFEWFIPHFAAVLKNPDAFRDVWEQAYLNIVLDYRKIRSEPSKISTLKNAGLTIIETPEPVSYYALFSATAGSDIVVSLYKNNRYEVEYKYTTWVDIISRPTLPRIPLEPLREILDKMESSGKRWCCDNVTETGPLLRLENKDLTKEEQFAHPTERKIYSSSILPGEFKHAVINYFTSFYEGIKPKKGWTWKEIKSLGITAG